MPSVDSSPQLNVGSSNALIIQGIIDSIPDLINLVSAAKASILPPQSNTNNTTTTTTTTTTTPEAAAVTITSITTTSNANENNIGSNTTTSISTPGNSNIDAAASAAATSTSTSGPAPSLASASALGNGSTTASAPAPVPGNGSTTASVYAYTSTTTTTTTEGGSNNSTNSNNANIKDEIIDGSCWMLRFSNKNPSAGDQKKENNITVDVGNDGSVSSEGESKKKLHNQLEKLNRDLNYIQSACAKLTRLELRVGAQFEILQKQGESLRSVLKNLERVRNGTTIQHAILSKQMQLNIQLISGMVMELKHHIPSPYKLNLTNEELKKSQNVSGGDSLNLIDEMLKIRDNKAFEECSSFENFKENYNSLDLREKLCLLCFSVFPENAIVKKRLLKYWWVGEGFIDQRVDGDKNPEDVADGILKKFLEKGFVEPEIKKRRLVGFRMHSLIRYGVIFVAEKVGFLRFDSRGNPTAKFVTSQRACLIKTGDKYSRQELSDMESKPETLHALFNVNDPYPDFKTEWFSRMRNVNILCLGRWEDSSKKHEEAEETEHHIEVDSTEFLKGLRNLKHLKFLSLQGISRVNEIPETIQKLVNLKILDLNACHNLEAIPENIGSLQKLTHLDISECYMLDYMPQGLGSLTELQVLKGFVISNLKLKNAGTLDDIKGLTKLRKLSIYTTKKDFPGVQHLNALMHITALRKLTIAWGGKSRTKKEQIGRESGNFPTLTRVDAFRRDARAATIPELPKDLVKLDLQCCPETEAPLWLSPSKLENLKKLYIRGGHLSDLGLAKVGNIKWNVKILRLKFLQELKIDWRKLHVEFPHLIYLEKFRCPKLTFFPCDGTGVWLDREKLANQPSEDLELTWSFLSEKST